MTGNSEHKYCHVRRALIAHWCCPTVFDITPNLSSRPYFGAFPWAGWAGYCKPRQAVRHPRRRWAAGWSCPVWGSGSCKTTLAVSPLHQRLVAYLPFPACGARAHRRGCPHVQLSRQPGLYTPIAGSSPGSDSLPSHRLSLPETA